MSRKRAKKPPTSTTRDAGATGLEGTTSSRKVAPCPAWEGLSPSQCLGLWALLRGENVTDAARAAGVDRRTVHRWRQEAHFSATLDAEREAAWEEHREQLEGLRGKALGVLAKAMDSERIDDVVLRAAITTLDRSGLPATKEIRSTGTVAPNPELADKSPTQLRALLREIEGGRS